MKIFRLIMLVLISLSIGYCSMSDRDKEIPITCTVVAKDTLTSGGKYPHGQPTLAVVMPNNRGFDVDVSLYTYSQFNVGDKIVIYRNKNFLEPNNFLYFLDFITSMIIVCGLLIWLGVELANHFEVEE